MIHFPNAKINLGLHVTEKRADGFHNIETVFYPIDLSDVLEVLPSNEFSFNLSGISIDGNPNDNLCVKAYKLLKDKYNLPPAYIQLHKIIPMGAGLGGGSADAAFVLKALNKEFNLNIDNNTLKQYAACLGSDCAFFIDNKPSIATGRGEIINPVEIDLKGFYLVLIKPDVHVSTADAYAGITPKQPDIPLSQIITMPVSQWRNVMVNDFETTVFKRHSQIADIKTKLYELGAIYAAMSGSGSSVFGLFNNKIDNIEKIFANNFIYTQQL